MSGNRKNRRNKIMVEDIANIKRVSRVESLLEQINNWNPETDSALDLSMMCEDLNDKLIRLENSGHDIPESKVWDPEFGVRFVNEIIDFDNMKSAAAYRERVEALREKLFICVCDASGNCFICNIDPNKAYGRHHSIYQGKCDDPDPKYFDFQVMPIDKLESWKQE
jgi:hypothetical protein